MQTPITSKTIFYDHKIIKVVSLEIIDETLEKKLLNRNIYAADSFAQVIAIMPMFF